MGLCSYLLIGYWGTRVSASRAALKAVIVNRVGDAGLMAGLMMMNERVGTWGYTAAEGAMGGQGDGVVGVLLLVGAMGKSAQVGMHVWLMDAMEGPTPVSALIHAATMVTAGVYLMVRGKAWYEGQEEVRAGMSLVGGITALMGGMGALVTWDMKKAIAYSTCSQLGYMIAGCGVGAYGAAEYHLMTHAVIKGLLIMVAGAVIHGVGEEQDMRRYGGLRGRMPLTYVMMLTGALSMAGAPYMSGMYSKERVIEGS